MSKNLRICFKVDSSLGLVVDEDGNYREAFLCVKAKNVKSYNLPRQEYEELQESFRVMIADNMKCDIDLFTPITLNEYLDNTEEEE